MKTLPVVIISILREDGIIIARASSEIKTQLGKHMSNHLLLLQDFFTFLSFLNSQPARLRGPRALTPSAVKKINALFCVRDRLDPTRVRAANGRWKKCAPVKKSERHTNRLRFLHYLAESANLVAPSGSQLTLTLRVQEWLDAPPYQRLAILFDAGFPPQFSRAQHERWLAYNLPELSLEGKLPLAQWLLEILRASAALGNLKFSTLLKLFRDAQRNGIFPEDESESASKTQGLLRELIELLESFGGLIWDGRAIEITELGKALLARDTNFVLPAPVVTPLAWTHPKSNRALPDLVADENADQKLVWQLHTYADHVATLTSTRAHRRLFRLDTERLYRALDAGESLANILDFLESVTADALAPRVLEWLDAIASSYGKIALRRAVLLETDDAALLQTFTTHKTIRVCIRRTLGPRALVVRPERVQALARRLKQRGYPPRLELAPRLEVAPPSQNPSSRDDATKLFDNHALGHLYLAAQVAQRIVPNARDAYKFPSALLAALQEKISASDQELAQTIARDLVQAFAEKQNSRSTPHRRIIEQEFAPDSERVSKHLTLVQRALENNTSLYIRYYSPYRNETTERTIEPLRLEAHHHAQYLIAYCHLERAERTFRVDRILEIMAADENARAPRLTISR